jgi:hypothetical protein
MLEILIINRPNSYEAVVSRDGQRIDGLCAVYHQNLGRYSPSVDDVVQMTLRWERKAAASSEEVMYRHGR